MAGRSAGQDLFNRWAVPGGRRGVGAISMGGWQGTGSRRSGSGSGIVSGWSDPGGVSGRGIGSTGGWMSGLGQRTGSQPGSGDQSTPPPGDQQTPQASPLPVSSPVPSPDPANTLKAGGYKSTFQANQANQANQAADDRRQQVLGTTFRSQMGSMAAPTVFNWQTAFSAGVSPQSASLSTLPAQTLMLFNGCGGTTIQSLVHMQDTTGKWRTLGFFTILPGQSATVGTTYNSHVYVFARDKNGKACDSGGRCWQGTAGPWGLEGPGSKQGEKFGFIDVVVPDSMNNAYTHKFTC